MPPSGYTQVFGEEFSGSSLPSGWRLGYYFNNSVPSGAVTVSGDALHLTWTRGGSSNDISISTNASWKYGYFEARMKWNPTTGAWPAFWMIPFGGSGLTGEIDIFEGQGDDAGAFFGSIHEWNGSSHLWVNTPNRYPISVDWTQYHTYGILWEPGGVFTWYLDGSAIHSATAAGPHPEVFDNENCFVILSMQEGANWSVGNLSGVSANSLTLDVDYFRGYQQGISGAPVITSFTATPSSGITSGDTVTLNWAQTGATTLTLNPGGIDVTGTTSTTVTVTATTTFQLIAANGSGSTTNSVGATLAGSGGGTSTAGGSTGGGVGTVLTFAPSSNPSYAGILHRSMIRIDWEMSTAQTVTVWKNFGTSLAVQVGGSTTTGAQNTWIRDVANGDVFSLRSAGGSTLASFTETVVQISTSFSSGFSPWAPGGWLASTSYPQGTFIIDSNGNLEIATQATTGTSGVGAHPIWPLITGDSIHDGSVIWQQRGPATAIHTLTGTLTWNVTGAPQDLITPLGLPDSVGLWTSSDFLTPPTYPIYGPTPPASAPITGIPLGVFQTPATGSSLASYMGSVATSGTLNLGIFNDFGPGALVGWVQPGARFYLTWSSADAIAAGALFSDAGAYFTLGTTDAPNSLVDYFLADPATILTFGTNTGTTTLKWKTTFDKVAIVYGTPQLAHPYIPDLVSNTTAHGNLVAAIDHRAKPVGVGQDFWQITLNGWVPNGGLFLLYDASTWNIENFADASNAGVAVVPFLRASLVVSVRNNSAVLTLIPNPIDAVSGSGAATLSWNAPDATAVTIRRDNAVTGATVATGGSTGSVSLTGLVTGTQFFLIDTTTGLLLRTLSAAVRPAPPSFVASSNPVPVSGLTYSTTLSWSGGPGSVTIRADDPLSGTVVTTGGASGSISVNQTLILNGRVFFLTDASGNVLSQVVVTLLYTGSLPTLFGLPIPDPTLALTAPVSGTAPIFPVDPDYAFQKSREWKTNILEFAPKLIKQATILREIPEISFDIGLAVQQGSLQSTALTTTKFRKIYAFYLQQKGSALPFYFFDPILWGEAEYTPVNYREDPLTRLTSPGTGVNPAPTIGRYIMRFAEDNLNFERFALLLVKSQLKLTGLAG
jgi:hypothetical protein